MRVETVTEHGRPSRGVQVVRDRGLAQALNQFDSQEAGESQLVELGGGQVVSPVHHPDWRIARLGTSDLAVLVELWERLWVGFSLSAREARRLATRLLVAAGSDEPRAD